MRGALIPLAVSALMLSSGIALPAPALSEEDRALIVQEVIEHFRKNPHLLAGAATAAPKDSTQADETPAPVAVPVSGNPEGDVTVFEFSDYGCAPCRTAAAAVDEAAGRDGSIRIVHHDYPSSGVNAAIASSELIAAWKAGKDWTALRRAYIENGVEPETRIAALEAAGLRLGELDSSNDEIIAVLLDNRRLATAAGVREMPSIIVAHGERIVALSGEITSEDVLDAAARLRAAGD